MGFPSLPRIEQTQTWIFEMLLCPSRRMWEGHFCMLYMCGVEVNTFAKREDFREKEAAGC